MTQKICRDNTYANARVDAVIAEAIAGSEEPFWIQAQTNLIRWVRTGYRLTGEPEPGIRAVADTAKNNAKLAALVKKAASRPESSEDATEARELERWLTQEWLTLDSKLTSRLTETLAITGASKADVTSRDGKHRTLIGERTGSWDEWDPASLPEYARTAALKALNELRAGSPWTNPGQPWSRQQSK